ncbi:serine/threonine protein kinase [bacterium]|nr:serine/threonine protein kinase [Planctomicrobium sp.]MDB4793163.1 serine/threonine protein kinase [bacterium]
MSNSNSESPDDSEDFESEPILPTSVGPYFIEKKLGSGGMGTVYLGRHKETDQFVAVKVLPASMAREAGFVARFDREIEAMRQLKNAHIVELYESGEDDGSYYYSMEYVEGETLADRLVREKKVPWQETIKIAVEICTALKSAHNAGIIHRDLKPSNLLIDKNGVVKLADFGVAQVFATGKLTATGGILGTAEYMSPEQAQGRRATKHSDIYSLGAVMYVMLTGRPPFTGKTPLDIIQKHRFAQFDSVKRLNPEVPFWLDEIVCKSLSKKMEERYPDAYVLSLRLEEVLKKVELQQQKLAEQDLIGATAETLAENLTEDDLADEVGGTLVRDLFKAQLEAEQSSSKITKLLDNPWVLIGLLILISGGAYGLSILNTPSQQAMFDRGVELMSRPPGVAWDAAKNEHFNELLELDAERWQPLVTPYLTEISIYELRKKLLGRSLKQAAIPETEPAAIILQAMELRKLGLPTAARQRFMALRTLLDQTKDQTLIGLLDQLIEETAQEADPERLQYLKDALDRAESLFEKGNIEEALSIWFGIKNLYDQNLDAKELVELAEQRYSDVTSAKLPKSRQEIFRLLNLENPEEDKPHEPKR